MTGTSFTAHDYCLRPGKPTGSSGHAAHGWHEPCFHPSRCDESHSRLPMVGSTPRHILARAEDLPLAMQRAPKVSKRMAGITARSADRCGLGCGPFIGDCRPRVGRSVARLPSAGRPRTSAVLGSEPLQLLVVARACAAAELQMTSRPALRRVPGAVCGVPARRPQRNTSPGRAVLCWLFRGRSCWPGRSRDYRQRAAARVPWQVLDIPPPTKGARSWLSRST